MNQCGIQRKNAFSVCEELRSASSSSSSLDRREHVVCPKPRRLGLLSGAVHDLPVRSLRWHLNYQSELCDPRGGTDLLDAILTKGSHGSSDPCIYNNQQQQVVVSSSPPFFSGSPPSRVANPLIQDARFGQEDKPNMGPIGPMGLSSPRKGGCVRSNFGNKPAVRVEGFDCLDRDSRNCSIPALA